MCCPKEQYHTCVIYTDGNHIYTGGNQGNYLQKESAEFCSLDTSGNSRASPLGEKTVNKGMPLSILSIFISFYLRNEFHFSGVHGAINRSGSLAK